MNPYRRTRSSRATGCAFVTIATAGPQFLGANELGYLIFKLTPQGQTMLAQARGNHLAARVTLADGSASAIGHIALVSFR